MTDPAPLRKVIFLAAVAASSLLAGCNDPDLSKTFAALKNVPVDGSGQSATADDRKLSRHDVELAVNTARDLTINRGGLLDRSGSESDPHLQIAIVDPAKMPRPDDAAPLDERVDQAEGVTPAPDGERPAPLQAPAAKTYGRFIQVGSFASADAAKNAWTGLVERFPGVDRYSPAYQSVTLASGKSMVRLKVGPVASDSQAESLCGQLDIRDSWCSKAS